MSGVVSVSTTEINYLRFFLLKLVIIPVKLMFIEDETDGAVVVVFAAATAAGCCCCFLCRREIGTEGHVLMVPSIISHIG